MDRRPPGSSVHGVSQARILEWVAMPFSRGSSPPRDRTQVFCMAGRFFTIWATGKSLSHEVSFQPEHFRTAVQGNAMIKGSIMVTGRSWTRVQPHLCPGSSSAECGDVTEPQRRVMGRLGETAVPGTVGRTPGSMWLLFYFFISSWSLSNQNPAWEVLSLFPGKDPDVRFPQGNRLNDRETGIGSGVSEGGQPRCGGLWILKAWKTHGLPRKRWQDFRLTPALPSSPGPPRVKGQRPPAPAAGSPLCGLAFPALPLAVEWAELLLLTDHFPQRAGSRARKAGASDGAPEAQQRPRHLLCPPAPLPSLLSPGTSPPIAFEKKPPW